MKIKKSAQRPFWNLAMVLSASVLLLAGCARPVVKSPSALPALRPLITSGATQYTVSASDSDVRFLVYRAGPLAAFGHNHVIHATVITGNVYLNSKFALSGFGLTLPVKDFRVDEPAQRAMEGADFAEQPSAAAISGTTHNMLGPGVLDAAKYPEIRIRSVKVGGSPAAPVVTVRITIHGVPQDVRVPVMLKLSGPKLTVSGKFSVKQTDFGMIPFSILGGGLQVANTVKVHFRIVAERK